MTVPHLNGQSDTSTTRSSRPLDDLLVAERATTARLRAELTTLRAEYERAAAAETELLLELARVTGEAEERAVRLMRAEELLTRRNGSDTPP